jgi:hypothetical protein
MFRAPGDCRSSPAALWKGLQVEVEQSFEVACRGNVIGRYNADLVLSILEKFYRSYRYIVQIVIREKAFASVVGLANF